jgi:transcriptional regulator GlxA family with amidase domain
MARISRPLHTFVRRLAKGLSYGAAVLVLPLTAGMVGLGARMATVDHPSEPPAYSQSLPATPSHDPGKRTAVILSSAFGAEITDFLPPYEILARSGAFNVYALAPERKPVRLVNSNMQTTSLDFVPHFSFAEYDAIVGQAPDLIAIPWFPEYTPERDAAVLRWIRAHAGPNTTLLTICAGTEILADTGLLNGHSATTNTAWFSKLEPRFPTVTWVRGVRYHDDGAIITSSNLATGIDATLHAVDGLVGRSVALDVARELGYRHTAYLDDARFRSDPTMTGTGVAILNAAYRWQRPDLAVLLYDGVSETALAAIIDLYSSPYLARVQLTAAQRGAIHSRNGLVFLPRTDFPSLARVDRAVLPGGDTTEGRYQARATWTAAHPDVLLDEMHRGVGRGESAYDATLRDMARTHNSVIATAMGMAMFYAAEGTDLSSPGIPVAPVLTPIGLAMLGLAGAILIGRMARPGERRVHWPGAAGLGAPRPSDN